MGIVQGLGVDKEIEMEKKVKRKTRICYEEIDGIESVKSRENCFVKVGKGQTFDYYALPVKMFEKIVDQKAVNKIRRWAEKEVNK